MSNLPHIAIDYTPAYEQRAGIGRYVRELIRALAHVNTSNMYHLFVAGVDSRQKLPAVHGEHFEWYPTRLSAQWLARIWHRLHLYFPVEVFVGQVDLFHATDFVLPPVRSGTKTLLTIHDLSFVKVPEAASPRLRAYLNHVVPRSIGKATHILADSEATRSDLISLYNVDPQKITTLFSGVDARFCREVDSLDSIKDKYHLSGRPYVFSVGTVQPRKNYSRLIEAVAVLRKKGYDICLAIAGGKGWLESSIYETIQRTGMEAYIHFLGFVAEEDLPTLYSGAICVAYPSLYEGFGFPVLEGMACGVPVLTSNISSLPEVAGDSALMVDPYEVEAIIEGLRVIIDDTELRHVMVARGYQHVSRFTWKKSAEHLAEIYTTILASPDR